MKISNHYEFCVLQGRMNIKFRHFFVSVKFYLFSLLYKIIFSVLKGGYSIQSEKKPK
jgi:hypothetical protein